MNYININYVYVRNMQLAVECSKIQQFEVFFFIIISFAFHIDVLNLHLINLMRLFSLHSVGQINLCLFFLLFFFRRRVNVDI